MASKLVTFLMMFAFVGSMASIEQDDKPITKRHYFSLTMRSELRRFIDSSSLQYVYSPMKQHNTTLETVAQNNVTVNETKTKAMPANLFSPSFLTLWSSDITKAMIEASRFKMLSSTAPARRATLSEMFQYNTSWVIGLAVCATVIGIFFLGCIIVICYTRRPYRRSGKVYEVETAAKKNNKKVAAAQVSTFHPVIRAATLTSQSKEQYY